MAQVMPDIKQDSPLSDIKVAEADCQLEESRLRSFMAEHHAQDDEARLLMHDRKRSERLSNQHMMAVLDHMMLCGLNVGLAKFLVKRPPRRLRLGQRRYLVSAADNTPAIPRPGDRW